MRMTLPTLVLLLAACRSEAPEQAATLPPDTAAKEVSMPDTTFTLSSPAFAAGGEIPKEYTCEGAEQSPPLAWSGAPSGTQSFALVIDDPDAPDPKAPKMTWVHWVVYDIPAAAVGIPAGAGKAGGVAGARDGVGSSKRAGYGGPCPPVGRHRYFHKLFALDTELGDRGKLTADALTKAMEGHVLGKAELIGTYQKSGR